MSIRQNLFWLLVISFNILDLIMKKSLSVIGIEEKFHTWLHFFNEIQIVRPINFIHGKF